MDFAWTNRPPYSCQILSRKGQILAELFLKVEESFNITVYPDLFPFLAAYFVLILKICKETFVFMKTEINFTSYIRKFRMEQLQSYMTNGLLIYGEIFAHFLIYQEALPHIWLCNERVKFPGKIKRGVLSSQMITSHDNTR